MYSPSLRIFGVKLISLKSSCYKEIIFKMSAQEVQLKNNLYIETLMMRVSSYSTGTLLDAYGFWPEL